MKNIKYGVIVILIIAIFSLSVLAMNEKEENVVTNALAVKNEKIGWGIKRNSNHEQPDCRKQKSKSVRRKSGNLFGK